MGETSGSAIRALSLGKPLVVSDVGWFAELPGDAVLKVPVDEHEDDVLLASLEALADPAVRAAMGAPHASSSSASTGSTGSPRHTSPRSSRWRAALAVDEHVLREVATAAAEVGLDGRCRVRRGSRGRLGGGWARPGLTSRPPRRPRSRSRAPFRSGPGWRALVVVSAAIRYVLARRIVAPWIMVDELIYSELAKSFADGGHFLIRGDTPRAYGFVYPAADRSRLGRSSTRSRRRTRRRRRSTRSSCRSRRSRRTCSRAGCSRSTTRSRAAVLTVAVPRWSTPER